MIDIIDIICEEDTAQAMHECESQEEMDTIVDEWIERLS